MKEQFDALIVEDNGKYAGLIADELDKLEMAISWNIVATEREFRTILSKALPDIVISEYKLEGFSGQKALDIIKGLDAGLPFILVSDQLGDKKAADIMVSGADDYVIKDNLQRLGLAVRRELMHYREQRRKQRLLEDAYQIANIGHWQLDLEEESLFWSRHIRELHEVEPDFEPGYDSALEFYPEGRNRERIVEVFRSAIEQGVPFEEELKIVTARGNERWVRVMGKPELREGQCIRVFGTSQDITDQKNTQRQLLETERKLRDIVEQSTNLFYRHDIDHNLTYVSPQSREFLGCPPEEARINWTEFLTDHPVNKQGVAHTNRAIQTGEVQPSYELQLQRTDGKIVWVQVNESPIVEEGKTVAVVGSLTDITRLKQAQEKQHMLAMVASETRNMVIITDAQERIVWVNDAFERITGYPFSEVEGRKPGSFLQGAETNPETVRKMAEAISREEPFSKSLINYDKEGNPYWTKIEVTPIYGEDGTVKQFFSIQEEITDRVEADRQLKSQKERLEYSQRIGRIGDWEHDLASGDITWSPMVFEIFNRDPGLGPPTMNELQEYYHPEDRKHMEKAIRRAIEKGERYDLDVRLSSSEEAPCYVRAIGIPEKNDAGQVVMLRGIVQDITKRKTAELALQQSEEQLSGIIDNIEGMFQRYILHPNGEDEYIYVSKGVKELHEIGVEEVMAGTDTIWLQVLPEDREPLRQSILESSKTLQAWDHKWRIRTPSGKLKWIHGRGAPHKLESGSILWDAIKIDVTEQERAKREREELYGLIEDSISEIYVMGLKTLEIIYANRVVTQNLGYSREHLYGKTPNELNPDFQSDDQMRLSLSRLRKGMEQTVTFETRHRRADGSVYPVQVHLKKGLFKGQEVIIAAALDITEEKKINSRLRSLLETAPLPIFIESSDGRIIDLWNQAAEQVLGYTKEEALNKVIPHVSDEQMDQYIRLLNKLKKGRKVMAEEIQRTRKDGTTFPARISASPLYNDREEIDSILVMLEDISQEKHLKQNLMNEVNFSNAIIDSLPGLFYMMDRDRRIVRVNKNVFELFDFDESLLPEIDPLKLIIPGERKKVKEKIAQVFNEGYAEVETVMFVNRKGYHFYINGKRMELDGQQYILGNAINITERVQTQQDNEVLLQEVHHRVKNNLAIISGLLLLEMENMDRSSSVLPLQKSINRIHSMAKVHELLYDASSFSSVNLRQYLMELTEIIEATFKLNGDIEVLFEVDDIKANVNEAIPLGMLFNELMTNSFKYAFENQSGKIEIRVDESDGRYFVSYRDNGKGFDGEADLEHATTLGMTIIHTLLKQLNAEFTVESDNQFLLDFNFEKIHKGPHANL